MAEILLVNPRKRRAKSRKAPSAAQRRARAAFAAMARARSTGRKTRKAKRRARRSNPVPALVAPRRTRRAARRAAPMRRRARRRNPIALGSVNSYVSMIKDAAIGGAGAVAVDYAYGFINGYLPDALKRTPGAVGVGDAVKAVITVALGKLLAKPTRGLSMTAARGSLVVQAHGLIAGMLPDTMTLGYAVPAHVVNASTRIGPNRLNRYTAPGGATPLLSRYTAPGVSPLISDRMSTMQRESIVR